MKQLLLFLVAKEHPRLGALIKKTSVEDFGYEPQPTDSINLGPGYFTVRNRAYEPSSQTLTIYFEEGADNDVIELIFEQGGWQIPR